MLRPEFVQLVHFRATSKPNAPAPGLKKYDQIISAAKFFTNAFNNEPGTDWPSQYDFRILTDNDSVSPQPLLVTATDTFDLDRFTDKVSQHPNDVVRIVHTDDNETEFRLVPADRLANYRYGNAVAVTGRKLKFSRAFTSDAPQIGGQIIIPGYQHVSFPDDDVTPIPIDDPNWLVLMCAGEFVRNDLTRKSEYPNLIGEAAVLMQKMKENAGARIDEIYRPDFLGAGEV